ncbi:MAG: hypothetical protein N2578_02795 [Bdellovibrionaceae bacterium]|nr:hypothetical protein [Pseudobdellovibrionaceae bacterium]
MKALTQTEVEGLALAINQSFLEARLQEVWSSDFGVHLGFWKEELRWLSLLPNSQCPLLLLWPQGQVPGPKPKGQKPMGLFLRAHAEGSCLLGCHVVRELGRVVRFIFGTKKEERLVLEFRLIPKNSNIHAQAGESGLWWSKPKDLSQPPLTELQQQPRSPEEIFAQYHESLGRPKNSDKRPDWREQVHRDIEKKKKALEKIKNDLSIDASAPYYKAGEILKSGEDLPLELKNLIDQKLSRSANIEKLFTKAKQIRTKQSGAQARIGELKKEIERLEKQLQEGAPNPQRPPLVRPLFSGVDTRKMELASGAVAWMGKSAKDNLALLRKASGHDLWFHLQDYPGAYAIVSLGKGAKLSEQETLQVARWLVQNHLRNRDAHSGRFHVLVAECRYVRPIKGDRLGRVTFQKEQRFTLDF